jgi:hypothetical protein
VPHKVLDEKWDCERFLFAARNAIEWQRYARSRSPHPSQRRVKAAAIITNWGRNFCPEVADPSQSQRTVDTNKQVIGSNSFNILVGWIDNFSI